MSWLTRLIHKSPANELAQQPPDNAEEPAAMTETVVEIAPKSADERLIDAAYSNDLDQVRELLGSEGPFAPETLGKALIFAKGVEVARLLLDAGADVDFQDDEFEETALVSHLRGSIVNIDLVRLLVAAGADPTHTAKYGDSPLKLAREKGDMEVLAELDAARPRKLDSDSLIVAAKYGAPNLVRLALEAGVDANSCAEVDLPKKQYVASPAIVLAAQGGHADVVRLLLDRGASPNTSSEGGQETALTAAVCGGDEATVRLLIESGADLDMQRQFDGCTPLEVAERVTHNPAIAQLIRTAGRSADGDSGSDDAEKNRWKEVFKEEIMRFLTKPETRAYEQQNDAWWTEDNLKLVVAKTYSADVGHRLFPIADAAIAELAREQRLIGTASGYRAR